MSSYLEIARVTATLQQMIQEALEDAVPGAIVRVGPPRAVSPTSGPEVNLYLYMVSPNSALRNQDLPTRSGAGGRLLQRPVVAMDLHYVISFYGEQELASERMMGKVVSRFNAHPILTSVQMTSVTRPGGSFAYLHPDRPEDPDQIVRLNPYYASLEELSKLWTVFFQMAHRVTLQYVAGPILIDADLMPVPTLPAAEPRLTVASGPAPVLLSVEPPQGKGPAQPIVLTGQNLQGAHVMVSGRRAGIQKQTPTTIELQELPAGLFAGVLEVSAVSPGGIASNSLPLALLPRIVSSRIVQGLTPTLEIKVDPTPAPAQPLLLLLNRKHGQEGFELGPALQFPLPATMQELTATTLRNPAFRRAFADAGVPFPDQPVLLPIGGGAIRVTDARLGCFCFLRHQDLWWVRYGLAEDSDATSIAFRIPSPLPGPAGEYLLRLRLLQTPPLDSLLLQTAPGAPYSSPMIVLSPKLA